MAFSKEGRRKKIQRRIRKNVKGTALRPRLSVYRSNNSIYCQLIDDVNGSTLAAASNKTEGVDNGGNRVAQAKEVGKAIASVAKGMNLENVVFDRGGYLYHGRVKALAEGAREGGLNF